MEKFLAFCADIYTKFMDTLTIIGVVLAIIVGVVAIFLLLLTSSFKSLIGSIGGGGTGGGGGSGGGSSSSGTTPPPLSPYIGLEIDDLTTGKSIQVDATGTTYTPTLTLSSPMDSIVFKQPIGTYTYPNAEIDIMYGEYAQPGTLVATTYSDNKGYWEYDGWKNGVPTNYCNTNYRYFIAVRTVNMVIYSDGIRLTIPWDANYCQVLTFPFRA